MYQDHQYGNDVGNNSESLTIRRFVMFETGTYNPVHLRPFALNLTSEFKHLLEDEIDRTSSVSRTAPGNNQGRFTPNSFRGRLFEFFAPTATPGAEVKVTEGWNTRRFIWMMEIDWYSPVSNSVITQMVTGSTDPTEVSMSGLIDPNLTFYINSCFDIRMTSMGSGGKTVPRLLSSTHLISDPDYSRHSPLHLMRHTDVLQASTIPQEYRAELNRMNAFTNTGIITDRAEASSRGDTNASSYLSNLISRHNQSLTSSGFDASPEEAISQTIYNTSTTTSNNRFLSYLRNAHIHFNSRNAFTYSELQVAFSGIDDILEVGLQGEFDTTGVAQNEMGSVPAWMLSTHTQHTGTNRLNGSRLIDQFAAILATSLPPIALECGFSEMTFSVTNMVNHTLPGELPYVFHYLHLKNLSTGGIDILSRQFEARVMTELLDNLSFNNSLDFHLLVRLKVTGDIKMEITLDDGVSVPNEPYCYPSFCDNLYSPMVTDNRDQLSELAYSVGTILDISNNAYGVQVGQSMESDPYDPDYSYTQPSYNSDDVGSEWDNVIDHKPSHFGF